MVQKLELKLTTKMMQKLKVFLIFKKRPFTDKKNHKKSY